MTSKKKVKDKIRECQRIDESNFREAAREGIDQHRKDGMIVSALFWARITGLYERELSLLEKIVDVVKGERANEIEGSDENTEKDLAAYDLITEMIMGGKLMCSYCGKSCDARTIHLHRSQWVGECCWDERLRSTE